MLVRMLAEFMRGARPGRVADATPAAHQALERVQGLIAKGDMASAEAVLRETLASDGQCAAARWLLGSVLGASNRLDEAKEALERAYAIEPRNAAGLTDLANVYSLTGRTADAERYFRRALAIDSANRSARLGLARIDEGSSRTSMAIDALKTLVAPPAFAPAVHTLVALLDRLGRMDEAKQVCTVILAHEPGNGAAEAALGFLLLKRDLNPEAALVHLERALKAGAGDEEVLSNRGIALQDLGRVDDALKSYDDALRLGPQFHAARFHRALALLLRGEFGRAWSDYEVRLQSEDAPVVPRALPRWNGEDVPEGSILVYSEQGIGDEIMFASCLPDLMKRCPNVVLMCSPKLNAIFRRSFPHIQITSGDPSTQSSALLDSARVALPIGSLPLYFRTSLSQFPRHQGYLRSAPELTAHYRDRLTSLGRMPKVGISWRGGTVRSRQALRTLNKDQLAQILDMPAIQFVNLQYDSTGTEPEIADAIASGRLTHWQEALLDYDRTAALVANLDVVVSVCTAVIHLSGALGRATWVMAPFSPEWRYGIAGERMPWYPSACVVRQPQPGAWQPVIETVRARLQGLVA